MRTNALEPARDRRWKDIRQATLCTMQRAEPGVVAAGRVADAPSQFDDWMPTFAELAGAPAPRAQTGPRPFRLYYHHRDPDDPTLTLRWNRVGEPLA